MSYFGRNPRLKSIVSQGDTLANLTAEPRVAGRLVYATDTQLFYYDDGVALNALGGGGGASELNDLSDVTLAAEAANQVLQRDPTNAFYQNVSALQGLLLGGGTASATNKIIAASDTLANLTALPRVAGAIYFATDDTNLYYDTGTVLVDLTLTGSGGGGNMMNPDNTVLQFNGTAGFTYTVPAGRYAYVQLIGKANSNTSATATPNRAQSLQQSFWLDEGNSVVRFSANNTTNINLNSGSSVVWPNQNVNTSYNDASFVLNVFEFNK